MSTTQHVLYGVKLGAAVIGGITEQGLQTGSEVRGEPTSGEPVSRFLSLVAQKPKATFGSLHLAEALTACGLLGVRIGGLTGGMVVYGQALAEGSTRASGTSHRSVAIAHGLVYPQKLSAEHGGDAKISYEAVITHNGAVDPLVVADGVALPDLPTDPARYTLGPVTVGGVSMVNVTSVEIDFGLKIGMDETDSKIWPTSCWIESVEPKITLRGRNLAWFGSSAVPLAGAAGTHSNTTVYFRRRASGSTFVADGTAQHLQFTASGLAVIDAPGTWSANTPGETSLTVSLAFDGTNYPLLVATASAIS